MNEGYAIIRHSTVQDLSFDMRKIPAISEKVKQQENAKWQGQGWRGAIGPARSGSGSLEEKLSYKSRFIFSQFFSLSLQELVHRPNRSNVFSRRVV